MLEQHIQRTILDYLRWKGIPCYKHQNAGIRKPDGSYIPTHTRGVSDIIGCLPKTGRFLAIEVKRPSGKPTQEQQQFIDTINDAGGLAFVAHSVEEVEEKLNGYFGSNNQRSTGRTGRERRAA
jgi:hypothetical protein